MYTPIQLDKIRNLRYGMKAISFIEKSFKSPIGKIDMGNLTMEDTAVIILAGLIHEDNTLTADKVMDLIDEYSNIQIISEKMGEALQAAFGGNEEGKNE
jgi:hypothetical protein